jgi:hypothetical protein
MAPRTEPQCSVAARRRVQHGSVALALALSALGCLWAAMADAQGRTLVGDMGYVPTVISDISPGSLVDARQAIFRVANSRNPAPSADQPCSTGSAVTNEYPLQIKRSPGVVLLGGRFVGDIPVGSDWQDTYCNSAALTVEKSPAAVVDGVLMDHVWDGVRIGADSQGFQLKGFWISDARDDCIEDDFLQGGTIEDALLDGCFSGVSTRPPEGELRVSDGGPLVMRGVLMRMQSYLYKGRLRQGVPFKAEEGGTALEIYDSIIAMDNPDSVSRSRLSLGWKNIGNCGGNLLLWTADSPWPDNFDRPPDCFQLVEGALARKIWSAARKHWLDNHPDVTRFADFEHP